jgi:hypothetical protein
MPRENAQSKAHRLLVGGAVSVLEVSPHRCTASVKGDTATHAVTFDGDRWACDCAAVGPCSHALAVARVVAVRAEIVTSGFVGDVADAAKHAEPRNLRGVGLC